MNRNDPDIIAFYTTKEKYGCFSNFYRSPIEAMGKTWPTTEHFYQAMKATTIEEMEEIRNAPTPAEAARIGRSLKEIQPQWDERKYGYMVYALECKFRQHDDLRSILYSTGDRQIIEWTEGTALSDHVWGNAKDKQGNPGQNLLGKALMEIRTRLRVELAEESEEPSSSSLDI